MIQPPSMLPSRQAASAALAVWPLWEGPAEAEEAQTRAAPQEPTEPRRLVRILPPNVLATPACRPVSMGNGARRCDAERARLVRRRREEPNAPARRIPIAPLSGTDVRAGRRLPAARKMRWAASIRRPARPVSMGHVPAQTARHPVVPTLARSARRAFRTPASRLAS